MSWVKEELKYADLGDKRRNKRLVTIVEDPERPATVALGEDEWRSLYCTIHKDVIARETQLPSTPPTLRSSIRWIAQLGGFLGRKGDGEPGVKTLWRGMQRLNDISATWTMVLSLMTALDDSPLLEEIGSWMGCDRLGCHQP